MTDTGDKIDGLEQMLCFDLYAANHAFGRFYKPLLDPMGLTYPQYLVLLVLWSQGGQSVGQIGQRLGLSSNTLTPVIKRLAAAGRVTRSRDQNDERRVLVTLTDAGAALEADAAAIPMCVARNTGMAVDEIRDLQTKLRQISGALNTR
ncbi:MarR family winged helix-turn-helix transcriptional regulator [Puniceibacterium sp. IMCC21224]|uniref:MarR family winged helix-turn-helix transcriptional regulator n=1 Tax=Puniceibacterium sp. IMCC21224 TaxID=1618204 RepID=UPI00064D7994|nr:MarR family transcriptional regulator [Puniceibacterium sp. IMCC21224]KMK65672.1 transcriptional regulator, MarR family [Puniceibacterium sp. IMCC21224]